MYYVATFDPHDDGSGVYDVTFADLPGCVSHGKNLDEALRMAAEALSLHVGGMLEDGLALPSPSTPEQARQKDMDEATREGYELADGVLWQYVQFEPVKAVKKASPVKLTISLKPAVVAQIDAVADEMGLTRSGAIAVATREYATRMGIGTRA